MFLVAFRIGHNFHTERYFLQNILKEYDVGKSTLQLNPKEHLDAHGQLTFSQLKQDPHQFDYVLDGYHLLHKACKSQPDYRRDQLSQLPDKNFLLI